MENKTVQSCTKTVHIRWLVSVFSGVLPLIQSCTPTNSPFELRAQLASMCTASCVCISHQLSSSCCTTHTSTVAYCVVCSIPSFSLCACRRTASGIHAFLLCALRSVAYCARSFLLCALCSIASGTRVLPLDFPYKIVPPSVHSLSVQENTPCTPSATHLPELASHATYYTATSVSRMLCSCHGQVYV